MVNKRRSYIHVYPNTRTIISAKLNSFMYKLYRWNNTTLFDNSGVNHGGDEGVYPPHDLTWGGGIKCVLLPPH